VTFHPVGTTDESGRRAWLVFAGAGLTGMATLFFDTTDHDRTDTAREDSQ